MNTAQPFQGAADGAVEREPRPLNEAEFQHIRRLAYNHFGLDLKEGKQALVVARLGKAMRREGFRSYEQYCRHVEADSTGRALAELGDALTTNFTSFLREPAHFDFLRATVLPGLAGRHSIEIWSAACSTGEEPYSILFTALEKLGPAVDVNIIATDISTRALVAARRAMYQDERAQGLPEEWRRRYFLKGSGEWQGWYRLKPEYRERVRTRRFNLISDPLPPARFPAVFCRNAMIYFDKPTQAAVVRRLSAALEPGGHLMIGHAESPAGVEHGLEYVQPAIYRKPVRRDGR
jgi:chemotaxis protein methyltransferase CheR